MLKVTWFPSHSCAEFLGSCGSVNNSADSVCHRTVAFIFCWIGGITLCQFTVWNWVYYSKYCDILLCTDLVHVAAYLIEPSMYCTTSSVWVAIASVYQLLRGGNEPQRNDRPVVLCTWLLAYTESFKLTLVLCLLDVRMSRCEQILSHCTVFIPR